MKQETKLTAQKLPSGVRTPNTGGPSLPHALKVKGHIVSTHLNVTRLPNLGFCTSLTGTYFMPVDGEAS